VGVGGPPVACRPICSPALRQGRRGSGWRLSARRCGFFWAPTVLAGLLLGSGCVACWLSSGRLDNDHVVPEAGTLSYQADRSRDSPNGTSSLSSRTYRPACWRVTKMPAGRRLRATSTSDDSASFSNLSTRFGSAVDTSRHSSEYSGREGL